MQLNLKTKVVRFELVDDEQETTITLSSEDDQATICRKLRRVLKLAEPARPVAPGKIVPGPNTETVDVFSRPIKEPLSGPVPSGNGWAKYAKPEVPEHLKGQVEMIEEGE